MKYIFLHKKKDKRIFLEKWIVFYVQFTDARTPVYTYLTI